MKWLNKGLGYFNTFDKEKVKNLISPNYERTDDDEIKQASDYNIYGYNLEKLDIKIKAFKHFMKDSDRETFEFVDCQGNERKYLYSEV